MGHPWKLAIVNATGNLRELTTSDRNEVGPDWSADGRELIFGTVPDLEDPQRVALYRVNVTSGAVKRLPGTDGLFSPRCSPDGCWVAALETNTFRLVVYNIGMHERRTLTTTTASRPEWTQDSTSVPYVYPDSPRLPLLCVRIADGKQGAVLARRDALHPAEFGGRWLGYAPDNSPLALRNVSNEKIFRIDWH